MKAKNKSVYQILCLDRRIKDLQWKYKIYRAGKRALKVEDKSGLLLFDTSLESLNHRVILCKGNTRDIFRKRTNSCRYSCLP